MTCKKCHPLKIFASYPAVQFAIEMVQNSYESKDPFKLFSTPFSKGQQAVPINGLIWMGGIDFMHQQIDEKIEMGFRCLKLKISEKNFEQEMDLLKQVRKRYGPNELEIRVDANGVFDSKDAMQRLEVLATFHIHSNRTTYSCGAVGSYGGIM